MLEISGLSKKFDRRGRVALDNIELRLSPKEVLGIAGESGSGKTTLAKIALGLIKPTTGCVLFEGKDIFEMKRRELKEFRRQVQIVWQDPDSSLDPRLTIKKTMFEPLLIHRIGEKAERLEKIVETFELVGLAPSTLENYPHQLSSGQRQRVAVARALMVQPRLLILDEPVSLLDPHLRLRLLELLADLKQLYSLTYLLISHDLAALRFLSDRIVLLNNGKMIVNSDVDTFFNDPPHPFARQLVEAG